MQIILLRSSILLKSSLVLLLSLMLSGCIKESQQPQLTKIQQAGELHVETTFGPANYYIEGNRPTGLEYELLKAFSEYIDVKLVIHPHYSIKSMLKQNADDGISLIAAGLNSTQQRLQHFDTGPSYYQVKSQLIYRKGSLRPRTLAQVKDPIYVIKSSSHEEYMQAVAAEISQN